MRRTVIDLALNAKLLVERNGWETVETVRRKPSGFAGGSQVKRRGQRSYRSSNRAKRRAL